MADFKVENAYEHFNAIKEGMPKDGSAVLLGVYKPPDNERRMVMTLVGDTITLGKVLIGCMLENEEVRKAMVIANAYVYANDPEYQALTNIALKHSDQLHNGED